MKALRAKSLAIVLVAVSVSLPLTGLLNGQVQKVADGFLFVEGPIWKDGVGLLFSDINGNTIYRWSPDSGASIYLRPSGNSNGLTLDHEGRLLAAQQGTRRVIRIEVNGSQTVLAAYYQGKRLNSPNDLVVKSDGSIWFTDPPYGISPSQEELGFYGIYRISPDGDLQLLDKSLTRPNGITFSPDEKELYVNDSKACNIFVWDVVSDTIIANRKLFASMSAAGYADGMKVDGAGNLFSAGPLGIWVFAADGHVLDTILVPGQTTNCNWGDNDRKTLYITSGTAVYSVRPNLTGIHDSHSGSLVDRRSQILGSFPNPFNPSTRIGFNLGEAGYASLGVYEILGNLAATLVHERLTVGHHDIVWNAHGVASDVYLCRFRSGGSVESRNLIHMR